MAISRKYIMHEEIRYYSNDRISPISEILLRRKLIKFLNETMEINKALEMLQDKSK